VQGYLAEKTFNSGAFENLWDLLPQGLFLTRTDLPFW
jgi:hypothetical protein